MAVLKNIFSFFAKFFLVFLGILLLITLGLFIYYLATIHSAQSYLPHDFLLYAEVDSIRNIYDNLIDLKAADVIFSTPDLRSIYNAILEFKSQEFAKNILFRKLLEVKASLVIHEDNSPSLAFDLGFLSIATRFFPVINSLYKIEELKLNTYQQGDVIIYEYRPDSRQQIFFSLVNNLIFVSTKRENLEAFYANYTTQKNLLNNASVVNIKDKLKKTGFINLFISSHSFIQSAVQENQELAALFNAVSLNELSALSFQVSNEDLELNAYTSLKTNHELFTDFFAYQPSSLRVIRYLSDTTNIYFSMNFKSFRNLNNIISHLRGQEFDKTIEQINNTCNLLFDSSIDELLFDWTGSEAGIFTMDGFLEPVLFLEIKNKAKMEAAFEKLEKSIVLKEDDSLVLDNVRIKHIAFPAIIRAFVDNFQKGLETPYYITMDDFIFFSMNPANLANLSNNYRGNKLLIQQQTYKEITRGLPKNANIFMYYNLSSAKPGFLEGNNVLSKLLSLYEKGVASLYFSGTELKLNISAAGIAGNKTMSFPGFPKALKNGTGTDVICQDIRGSRLPELIYLDKDYRLVVRELGRDDAEAAEGAPIKERGDILLSKNRLNGNFEIFIYTKSGIVYKFDTDGQSLNPFPLITNFKNSFPLTEIEDKLFFYNKTDKALYFLTKTTGEELKLNFDLPHPVLSSPSYLDGYLAFYPKNFTGTVYLTDLKGKIREGWPKDGGGVSYCSPLLYKNQDHKLQVFFLTQAGYLNVWDENGRAINYFPVKLEGVYYINPALITFEKNQPRGFLALSEQGKISLINQKGHIIKEKLLENVNGKQAGLVVFDMDRDGLEEVFIYGTNNFITGLDSRLEVLPGFPVKGSYRPAFVDLNYDGKYELVSASYDNNLYAYTLSK